MVDLPLSTGLAGLDRVFKGLLPGDNLVWEVTSLEDYRPLVAPYCRFAHERGRKLVYFRFADHAPLTSEAEGATVRTLSTAEGFEQFITDIHRGIHEAGRGAFFVFDCLSTLAEAWLSDRMLGNFFMLTCPYVLDQESLAYFPLLRDRHSIDATKPIANTTQIFVDVYRHQGDLYIHPTKVQHRFSPTMYTLHRWEGEQFTPVTESSTIAEILTAMPWSGVESARFHRGLWNANFLQAEKIQAERLQLAAAQGERRAAARGDRDAVDAAPLLRRLMRMIVSRDPRVLALAERYFTLDDVLDIWKRMIGTGLIGGKSVGMLLARAILKRSDPKWAELLEAHDSFFIGSDVFYSYLVENGCWWLRQKQRDKATFLNDLHEARRRIIMGKFPEAVVADFAEMLDYFGQSPIIVRSSSLLEDNYGNAFAGKYESVFCANQGPHHKRLDDFVSAVKTIYASTMSEKALRYREQRGLLDLDEQMPLLVQRVSGARHDHLFYPQVAGVALSRNPYVWNEHIDPEAGMLRLVFGLGTRAVDRADDDYTRVVALNAPERRPESSLDDVRRYSQRRVDVIDIEANQLVSHDFIDIVQRSPNLPLEIFASDDPELRPLVEQRGLPPAYGKVLTFEELLSATPFTGHMREMLHALQAAYDYPVDTEFTANFFGKGQLKINLLQCRPLQVSALGGGVAMPERLREEDVVLRAHGAVIGPSRQQEIDRLIYVVPSVYGQLPLRDRYSVARLIGQVIHRGGPPGEQRIMLVGPGRWGTTTPSLGVPVTFTEIDAICALCEIVAMRDDLVPDVSLGTHFFNDLVEMDILYLALFPGRKGNELSRVWLEQSPNRLGELLPEQAAWQHVVRVIDFPQPGTPGRLKLHANTLSQEVVCYHQPQP